MEYVSLRCGCGTMEQVPIGPGEEARGDGAACSTCMAAWRPLVRSSNWVLALAATGLAIWLWRRTPRAG